MGDTVIYLSGVVRRDLLGKEHVGVLLTPLMGNAPDLTGTRWAADNGCFSQPQRFTVAGYLAWLRRWRTCAHTCLFATAPDVLANARATWERSAPVLPLIRQAGYHAALVAQDGFENLAIEWGAFDALFIGGSTAWKLSAAAADAMGEARRRGKWVHVGRVNSGRRLRAVDAMGANSVDGTYLRFGPDVNLPRMERWLEDLERAPSLWRGLVDGVAPPVVLARHSALV